MPAINHVWLIRHGETPWSLSGQHTGKTEKELTPTGVAMGKRSDANWLDVTSIWS